MIVGIIQFETVDSREVKEVKKKRKYIFLILKSILKCLVSIIIIKN